MVRLVVLFFILLISCRRPSVKAPEPGVMDNSLRNSVVRENEQISCDSIVAKLVQSSNAIALVYFGKELVQSRIATMTSDKATIELYVVNDNSETPT